MGSPNPEVTRLALERTRGMRMAGGLLLAALISNLASATPPNSNEPLAVPYRFTDVERWAPVFENPQRDLYQMPERVIATLRLTPGAVIADVGAATGYFARRFGRDVGATGQVFAVDIEPKLLAWLDARAKAERIVNIRTILGTTTDSRLPDKCCDLIFLCNTYHMIASRVDYLHHLRSKLKADGRIVIIEWRKQPLPRGPKPEWKLTDTQILQETTQADLCVIDRPTFLPYQYFFVLQPCARTERPYH